MNKKTLIIVGAIVVVLLIVAAVNRKSGNGNVEVNGDDVTVTTDEGTWSSSNKLPDNFPSDVPVYPGAKVQASIAASGQDNDGNYVSLQTSDDLEKVIAWYKKEIKQAGWTVDSDAMIGENLILSASKENRALNVTVSDDNDMVIIGLAVANK